jgi:methyl-accepting chemotaxis protein
MEQIATSSRNVAEIINVIDGIAFQTNILALNAAVEAARAGDQGRGFAVVASEVRNLAHRSAQAAREIKDMINESVKNVDSGTRLVSNAGTSMSEIVGQVKRVHDLIGEITSGAEEQSTGISQVNEAVTQMDKVTQQNAALVEQSAAAGESLKEQAEILLKIVEFFRIDDGVRAPRGIGKIGGNPTTTAIPKSGNPPTTPRRPASPSQSAARSEGARELAWEEF